MAISNKQKDRIRRVIRIVMVTIAVFLLLLALVVPVANNAVALGVERELKALPLPPDTEMVASISKAAKLTGNGNGMQYFGAVLLKSELSSQELNAHYAAYAEDAYDYLVEPQSGTEICPRGESLHGGVHFSVSADSAGYYVLYSWGSAPEWARDWLDTDLRGH